MQTSYRKIVKGNLRYLCKKLKLVICFITQWWVEQYSKFDRSKSKIGCSNTFELDRCSKIDFRVSMLECIYYAS